MGVGGELIGELVHGGKNWAAFDSDSVAGEVKNRQRVFRREFLSILKSNLSDPSHKRCDRTVFTGV